MFQLREMPGRPRSEETVVTLIEDQVERFPGRLAVVDGETELTYREINIRANRLAHRLIGLGVGPDVVVGVYAESSIELVVALLAVLKSGGTYVPLDPAYPHERLQAMLEDCTPAILLSRGPARRSSGRAESYWLCKATIASAIRKSTQ